VTATRLRIAVIGARGVGGVEGGIETYCSSLYVRLASDRFDITIFVSRQGGSPGGAGRPRIIKLPTSRLGVLETPMNATLGVIMAWLAGIRTLHVHGLSACLCLPLAHILGMRTIVRHMGAEYERTKWGSTARAVLKISEKFAARFAESVVCLNSYIADRFFRATGRAGGVFVVPNGVERPPLALTTSIQKRLALEPYNYVLAVGRLVPEKNFHVLLEAFGKARIPASVKLVIVGAIDRSNRYARTLNGRASDPDRVVFSDNVFDDDLWSLYRYCGLFVLPSMHEGMSFALLEAASAGAKIVASDIPANALVCGEFARLAKVNCVDALSVAMEREWVREQTREQIARQAEICATRHDWGAIRDRMEGILTGARASGRRGAARTYPAADAGRAGEAG